MGVIQANQIVLIQAGDNITNQRVYVGGTGDGSTDVLNQTGGTFNVANAGQGSWVVLGDGAGNTGTYNISGGTFNYTGGDYLQVGDGGVGNFNLSDPGATGTTANMSNVTIGRYVGGVGNYTQNDATSISNTPGNFIVGDNGTGTATLNNGTLNANITTVGNNGTSTGTLTVNGGAANVGWLREGASTGSNGTVTLTGGTVNANNLGYGNYGMQIGGNGTATFSQFGGTAITPYVNLADGAGSQGTFNFGNQLVLAWACPAFIRRATSAWRITPVPRPL